MKITVLCVMIAIILIERFSCNVHQNRFSITSLFIHTVYALNLKCKTILTVQLTALLRYSAMTSSRTKSNSFPEEDILLTSTGKNIFESQDNIKVDGETYPDNACQRCLRKISKENWFVILTVIGVIVGALIGTTTRWAEPSENAVTLIAFPGELFMRMLKMLILPILFTSVVVGLASIDFKRSGKMWLHCFAYYITTTVLASILGITLVTLIHPGNPNLRSAEFTQQEQKLVSTFDSFLDLLRNMVPDNIVAACFQVMQTKLTKVTPEPSSDNLNLTSNDTRVTRSFEKIQSTNALGVMVFAIFFGVTVSALKNEAKAVADFMESLNKVFMRMILIVLWFSPLGISSLIAGNLLRMKSIVDVVDMLGLYMVTVITGLVIHCLIIIPLIYFIVTKKNPYKFYYGLLRAVITAFGTGSSVGTLPHTMKCLEDNIGIDKRVSQLVLPLGATMNMDGTALMEGVAAITIAQMYNANLTAAQIVTVSITATLTSIGAAAIPSSGLVMLLIVLNAIGIPSDVVGLLWSIDWFLDRLRTVVNVLGDSIGAGIVNHLNKELLMQQSSEIENEEMNEKRKQDIAAKELYQICDSGVSVMTSKHEENML